MQVPLNIIHDYIGIPVLGILSYDTMRRYFKNHNQTTLYFCLFATYSFISVCFFGLPALFSHDKLILSTGTFIGDTFQAASFLCLWFICIRAFVGSRPRVVQFLNILAILLSLVLMLDAIQRNLTYPYSTSLVLDANRSIALIYVDTLRYKILSGINSLVFFFTGYYFWRQAKDAPEISHKVRIRTLAIAMVIAALAFTVTPTFALDVQPIASAVILSISLLFIGIGQFVGHLLAKKPTTAQSSSRAKSE